MSGARPAVGHMPFPGHRNCAQWKLTSHNPPRVYDLTKWIDLNTGREAA
jgi:hypothetical protein